MEVVSKSKDDGNVNWKVVKEVTDNLFTKRLKKEEEWLPYNFPLKEKVKNTQQLFEKLWPRKIDKEFKDFC